MSKTSRAKQRNREPSILCGSMSSRRWDLGTIVANALWSIGGMLNLRSLLARIESLAFFRRGVTAKCGELLI